MSVQARVASACIGEGCACPWKWVGSCKSGCAADGVDVVMDETRAAVQLCVGDAAWLPENVPLPASPRCDEPGEYSCERRSVRVCETDHVLRGVAVCAFGCAAESIDGVSSAAAIAILCARTAP